MPSMTDFIQETMEPEVDENLVQESEVSEEEIATSIVESYMAMEATSAHLSCIVEFAGIASFCEANEIETPEVISTMMEAWTDTVKDFFANIIDWFAGIIRGIIAAFGRGKLNKLIAKLKQMKQDEKIKKSSDVALMAYHTETIMGYFEKFRADFINDSKFETKKLTEFNEELTKLVDSKNWSKGVISGESEKKDMKKAVEKHDGDWDMTIGDLVAALEKINQFDMPRHGSALLKELKFDEKNYKEKGTENVDKDKVRAIKLAARLLAKAYDKITQGLVKVSETAYGKTEVKNAEKFKTDVEAAAKNTNSVHYNSDEKAKSRPKNNFDKYFD